MRIPKEVRSYIASTRFELPRLGGWLFNLLQSSAYRGITNHVLRMASKYDIDLGIHIVRTDSMRTEIVGCRGKHFLIYDSYFRQVVNSLNRLFVYNCPREQIETYSWKLCSHALSRYGFFELSAVSGMLYKYKKVNMDHISRRNVGPRAVDGLQKHTIYTPVQEAFVMLHEVAHLLLKTKPDFAGEMTKWPPVSG